MSANPTTSPVLIGESPVKLSPWELVIEKVIPCGPIDV
jgi:hypothetical protein